MLVALVHHAAVDADHTPKSHRMPGQLRLFQQTDDIRGNSFRGAEHAGFDWIRIVFAGLQFGV